ncbi:cationic peroxidase 2-like [Malania oleifera]|uniref:cationic peroxidase 2-like n=1 Tax=Malania oleifera TaxID=397392 RepID=UPI0025ADC078|nr:cationic peroxidase 2-like [Malania oleifera]
MTSGLGWLIFLFVLAAGEGAQVDGNSTTALTVGFYDRSCPEVESIVRATMEAHFASNSRVAPGILRMFFHDCFVRGCDGSVLLDGPSSEKTAPPNRNLRGFEAIEEAKAQLESACPGVVSCADILALAARDAVILTNGPRWSVPTGRRDGLISLASETANLPSFLDSVETQKQKFSDKGLNLQDMVTLVGGHTIGTTACQFLSHRLYNFNKTSKADPSINPSFLPRLKALCPPNGDAVRRVELDTDSSAVFDTSYFSNLKNSRGVLASDQLLWNDNSTKPIVRQLLGVGGPSPAINFNMEFGNAMVKMGAIQVKTGAGGEIRKICSAPN